MRYVSLRLPLLALLALSACAHAETTITFETPGERISALLTDWNSKFGLKLNAAKSTADEVVAVRLKDVPVQAALDRLAEVLHATWDTDQGRMFLNRSASQEREQNEAERFDRVEEIRKAQVAVAHSLAEAGTFDRAAADKLADDLAAHIAQLKPGGSTFNVFQAGRDIDARGPLGRAISQLRIDISPEDLADLPLGIRVVYSTSPTKLQRALPDSAKSILSEVMQDQNLWVQAASSHNFQAEQGAFAGELAQEVTAFEQVPTRALFVVTRLTRETNIQFELILADDRGHIISDSRNDALNLVSESARLTPNVEPTAFEVPEDARSIALLLMNRRGTAAELSPELRSRLLQPAKFDPLSLAVGATLVAAAKAKGDNLVALMSDSFWRLGAALARSKSTTVEDALRFMRRFGAVSEQSGWLEIQPLTPVYDRSVNVDRSRLTAYLHDRSQAKPMSIEQRAAWALELPRQNENALPDQLVTLLMGPMAEVPMSEDLLRFYGGMSDAQRKSAASADGLPLTGLSETSSAALNRILFGFGRPLTYDIVQSRDHPLDIPALIGLGSEPTEVFGNGFPAGSKLTMTEKTGTVVASYGSQIQQMRFFDASQLANLLARQSRPDVFPGAAMTMQAPTSFYYAPCREITLRFDFSPMLHCNNAPLRELNLAGQSPVPYASLPADFRADVDQRAATLKERFSKFGAGNAVAPRQSTPPPIPR
jgi:hypothetical protein